jgi:hypothetical protein
MIAARLKVPVRWLADDSFWPDSGLPALELKTLHWMRTLYEWYIQHAGTDAAHKYLSLDFELLRRQSQILQQISRVYGSEPLIRVFVSMDHEEGRYDREFTTIERLAIRIRGVRSKILSYVSDVPMGERRGGRTFLPLVVAGCEFEITFTNDLPQDRTDVRYCAEAGRKKRKLWIRSSMDDSRLAFILAREVAVHLAGREELIPAELYREHHWPCAIDSYQRAKAHVMINRFAAALLLPREMMKKRVPAILLNFSYETMEESCRELGCAPETLLLRIVQLYQKESHFIRIDAPSAEGPHTLRKLFCGNGLRVQHRYASGDFFPSTWGIMKSLSKFFAAGSAASRHVQITRMPQWGNETYICMSLSYPRFGGGAKALCVGYKKAEFEELYGGLPTPSEKKPSMDSSSSEIDWNVLSRLEKESRHRSRF